MKTITKLHTKDVFTELCKRVGVSYDTFDFSQKEWYFKHLWTEEEQEYFRKWLAAYLIEKKYFGKKEKYRGENAAYYEAGHFIMNYGWKTKV